MKTLIIKTMQDLVLQTTLKHTPALVVFFFSILVGLCDFVLIFPVDSGEKCDSMIDLEMLQTVW